MHSTIQAGHYRQLHHLLYQKFCVLVLFDSIKLELRKKEVQAVSKFHPKNNLNSKDFLSIKPKTSEYSRTVAVAFPESNQSKGR